MVGRTLLHYTITAELGAGAMGRVYLARDTRTERRVAIKFLSTALAADAESRERLVREARAASRLSHAGIVTLYSLEEADGQSFLVQEFVEGETLAQRLARGPLGAGEVLRLARELGEALAHAHAQGVVHRDLKPDNILIGPDAHYKVADFGIAHVEGAPTMTAAGTLFGTLPYMAPERLRGGRGDARADLYALGAILYEAMSGRRAIGGQSEAEALYQVMNEAPAPLEPASPALAPLAVLVMTLLAKEPRERPENASQVLELMADHATPSTRLRIDSRPRHVRTITVTAAILILVVGALVFAWRRSRTVAVPGAESSIAVLYFENVGDPADGGRLGPITSNLLITSLAQTDALHVLSTQRILDALVALGRGAGAVDRSVALQVARKLRAGRIVTGSILQSTPILVMTVEVSNVEDGEVVAATRIEGEPGQTVFQVVDALGARLLSEIGQGHPKALETVALRASSDLQAMKAYVEGLEQLSRGDPNAASALLSEAVRRDPGFAQAHFQLAIAEWWKDDWANASTSVDRALVHAARLSPFEREIVRGLGLLLKHRYDAAIEEFTRLARLHPGDKLPLYGLVEAYYHSTHHEQAIVAARRLLAMDPRFSPAASHLGDALLSTGSWQEAEREIQALIRSSPDDALLGDRLAEVRVLRGDGAGAVSAVRRFPHPLPSRTLQMGAMLVAWDSLAAARVMMLPADAATTPAVSNVRAHYYDLMVALHQGRFRVAEAIARRTLKLSRERRHSGRDLTLPPTYRNGISAAIGARDTLQALAWADSAAANSRRFDPEGRVFALWAAFPTWARLGRTTEALTALQALEALPMSDARESQTAIDYYWGWVEFGRERWPEAVHRFRRANAGNSIWLQARPSLARAMMRIGMYSEALGLVDTTLRAPVGFSPDQAVLLHLYRAQILEKLKRPAEAAESYRRLLYLWRQADPGTPEVGEATAALARLEGEVPRR